MALPKIPYKGTCLDCSKEAWIVRRIPPICQFCNYQRKQAKKKSKPKSLKIRITGEADVFFDIWVSKPRVSFVTGDPLPDTFDARSFYFSHVLAKGKAKYPMFKIYKKNIVFKTLEEHELWEYHKYALRPLRQWDHVFALEEELKKEYELHKELVLQGKAEFYKI